MTYIRSLQTNERLSKDQALEVMREVHLKSPIKFSLDDTSLVRIGMNAVFATEEIIIRIHPAAAGRRRAEEQILMARFLLSEGIRTPAPLTNRPLASSGAYVTIWQRIEEKSGAIDPEELGRVVRKLHTALDRYDGSRLQQIDYFQTMKSRIKDLYSAGIDKGDIQLLERIIQGKKREWAEAKESLAVGVVHGDIHQQNVLLAEEGLHIIDFDWISVGPREMDLFKTSRERFGGDPGFQEAFLRSYGISLTRKIEILSSLRLLSQTAILVSREQNDATRAEFEKRMDYWRSGEDPSSPHWSEKF